MSRNTKIIIAIGVGTLAALFLCAGLVFFMVGGLAWNGLSRAVDFDADQVTAEAAGIAHFQLPAGYRPNYTFHAAGFTLVAFDPGDNHSHLMLVQAPAWVELDPQQFEAQLRRDFGARIQWGENERTTVVDQRTLRVDGEPVEFAVSEGINGDGGEYRSMAGVWNSPNGQVLIYIEEPVARWNQAEIDAFITTIES